MTRCVSAPRPVCALIIVGQAVLRKQVCREKTRRGSRAACACGAMPAPRRLPRQTDGASVRHSSGLDDSQGSISKSRSPGPMYISTRTSSPSRSARQDHSWVVSPSSPLSVSPFSASSESRSISHPGRLS